MQLLKECPWHPKFVKPLILAWLSFSLVSHIRYYVYFRFNNWPNMSSFFMLSPSIRNFRSMQLLKEWPWHSKFGKSLILAWLSFSSDSHIPYYVNFRLNPGVGIYKVENFIFSPVSSLRSWHSQVSHLFLLRLRNPVYLAQVYIGNDQAVPNTGL